MKDIDKDYLDNLYEMTTNINLDIIDSLYNNNNSDNNNLNNNNSNKNNSNNFNYKDIKINIVDDDNIYYNNNNDYNNNNNSDNNNNSINLNEEEDDKETNVYDFDETEILSVGEKKNYLIILIN
jgi:hypothetical protein